jgi:hypothetical protein
MNQQLLQGTEKVVCTLQLSLIETREQLELKDQKVRELQSILKDKETEINFLKEVLSARANLILHQNSIIDSLEKRLEGLKVKSDPPVIVMKTYLPGLAEEQLSETAI